MKRVLDNPHVQSVLASSSWRLRRLRHSNPVQVKSEDIVLQTPDARLLCRYAAAEEDCVPKQLVVLLHGWEGRSESTYIQLLADTLYRQGISIARLNFRDHGNTHHLNRGLFHSCRLDEVADAVRTLQDKYQPRHLFLAGFSLGGNFAIRVNAVASDKGIKLAQVFAVSPVVDPRSAMLAIEASPVYRRYFLRKWKKSLQRKQQHYPEIFTGKGWKKHRSLDALTQELVLQHTPFEKTTEYYRGYELTETVLNALQAPTHVITAEDDPIIPVKDFKRMEGKENIRLLKMPQGGHCGFVTDWRGHSWVETYISRQLQKHG